MADALHIGSYGWPRLFTQTATLNTFALNETTDQWEYIFQAPPNGSITITRLGFRLSSITGTTPTYRISLQGVDASGNPDGTIKGGGSPASVTFSPSGLGWSAGTWHWLTLDNSYATTTGEMLAMVIDYSSGTIDASNLMSVTAQLMSSNNLMRLPYAIQNNAGSRTKMVQPAPWGFGTASVAYGFPLSNYAAQTFHLTTTPDEYALKFTMPAGWGATFKVKGVKVLLGTTAGSSILVSLYDGTTALQTVTLDTDHVSATSGGITHILFDESSLSTLDYGTAYRIGLAPQSAVNATIQMMTVDAAADFAAWDFGENCVLSTRTDSGAWTDDATRRFLAEPIFDDFTEPAGGAAGGFYISG